jgi:hypothetical protein
VSGFGGRLLPLFGGDGGGLRGGGTLTCHCVAQQAECDEVADIDAGHGDVLVWFVCWLRIDCVVIFDVCWWVKRKRKRVSCGCTRGEVVFNGLRARWVEGATVPCWCSPRFALHNNLLDSARYAKTKKHRLATDGLPIHERMRSYRTEHAVAAFTGLLPRGELHGACVTLAILPNIKLPLRGWYAISVVLAPSPHTASNLQTPVF